MQSLDKTLKTHDISRQWQTWSYDVTDINIEVMCQEADYGEDDGSRQQRSEAANYRQEHRITVKDLFVSFSFLHQYNLFGYHNIGQSELPFWFQPIL